MAKDGQIMTSTTGRGSHTSTARPSVEVLEERALLSASPSNLVGLNGALYFTATDPKYGAELWRSDGSPTGTALVKVLGSGGASLMGSPVKAGNLLFFAV